MGALEDELVKTAIRGFVRAVILWLVSRKPMSGYSLSKELKRLVGWDFNPGAVYPLLYELEENRLLEGKWTGKGRRRIKYYSITESGNELLTRIRSLLKMPVKEILKDLISQP